MKLKDEEGVEVDGSHGWFIIILGILIIASIILTPWQAFQNEWVVEPNQSQVIRWHECLTGGGSAVILETDQMIRGIVFDNKSQYPITIKACTK